MDGGSHKGCRWWGRISYDGDGAVKLVDGHITGAGWIVIEKRAGIDLCACGACNKDAAIGRGGQQDDNEQGTARARGRGGGLGKVSMADERKQNAQRESWRRMRNI